MPQVQTHFTGGFFGHQSRKETSPAQPVMLDVARPDSSARCAGVGCILASTATIVIIPTVTAAPPSTTSSITPLPPPIITTTSSVASFTSTPSPSSSAPITSLPTTSSLLPSTLTCSSGFQSCPASLGGGCCPTDRACGSALCSATSTSLAGTSSSNALGAPVRPTSIESTITGTTTVAATFPPTSTLGASQCPTGFYQCSAYYVGGACCRVGRDCSMTDCPAASTGTALVSDGVTVAVVTVPSGTATAAAGAVVVGTCANGWQTCPATQGGGCCPSDFTCAEQNCVKQVTEVTGGSSGASSSVVRLNWDLWSGIGITVAAFLFVFCV
ncbi:Glycoside hydrolase 18 protein [Agyrium rufum]|nr:Glycoside hydrolase 18 protein [Agyrium rufum]